MKELEAAGSAGSDIEHPFGGGVRRGRLLRYRRVAAVALTALILVPAVLLFASARRQEEAALRTVFGDRARPLAAAIRVSCEGHLEVLLSLNALYLSSSGVSREEFGRFVASALQRHPGIRALSWNPRIVAADRARFEAETGVPITWRDGRGRRVRAPEKAEYVVVHYVEPAADRKAVGIDVTSEPVRREALARARDTGSIAATGPLRLVNDDGERLSILFFAPVYASHPLPATVEQRRRDILGYTTGVFRLSDLVETAIRDLARDGLTVTLLDHRNPDRPELLFASSSATSPDLPAPSLLWRERFLFGGRPWEVRVAATPEFLTGHRTRRSWLILLGGGLLAGTLGILFLVVTGRAATVEDLVVRRTAELQSELLERWRAEGIVRVSEARNRALLDNMIGGIITFTRHSRIESVNPAAERILGYREEELLGQSIAVLIAEAPPADPDRFLRAFHRASVGRVTEAWGRRKNGELFFAEAALFEFMVPEGRRFACSFQDISERREVDRLKAEFVSTVSHELRTPLTSIRGSLGLLVAGALGELPPAILDFIRLAERNAVRLTVLINDILDFERLDGSRARIQVADVDLQSVFEQALDSVRPVADGQQIALICAPTGLRLRMDAVRICQVLVNLLSNAVKFSPPQSEVRVWAEEKEDGGVRVCVEDRGQGIPDKDRHKIFERFVRLESSDKGGTGLGLAICKAIIELHGGAIGVDSTPGAGSTFWFDLPAADEQPPE